MKKKICIIPVRLNSRRVPRKNFRLFAGLSLLEIAISSVRDANIFDEIYVCSDNQGAEKISNKMGVMFAKRSEEPANNERFLIDVVKEFIHQKKLDSEDRKSVV